MKNITSRVFSFIIVQCLLLTAFKGTEVAAEYMDRNLTDWRSAYYYKILETYSNWVETTSSADMKKRPIQFTIYDMDKNGTPELLIQDYWETTVYEYVKGNGIYPGQDAVKIGNLDSYQTVLCSYPNGNGIIAYHNGQDATVVRLFYFDKGNLYEKMIYNKYDDSDYGKPPKEFVPGTHYLTMYDLLDDYVFWEYERTVN